MKSNGNPLRALARIALPLLALLAALPCAPAMTLVTETETDGVKDQVRIFIADGKLRIDASDASSIMLMKERKVVMILHTEKTYATMSLPPEQRPPLPDAQGPGLPPPPSAAHAPKVEKTGRTETIGSYPCTEWRLTYPDKTKEEWWVSEKAPLMSEIASRFGDTPSMPDLGNPALAANPFKLGADLPEMKHFPVRQLFYDAEGRVTAKTTLISADTNPAPAHLFAPPKNYKRQDIDLPAQLGPEEIRAIDGARESLEKSINKIEKELKDIDKEEP